jgi:carbon monoxide dehydrogenase subunit G
MAGADVRQTDPEHFEGELKVNVGPIGATFSGSVAITQKTPPLTLTATLKGKDKMTGSRVEGEFTSSLKRIEPAVTEVAYKIDVTIRGKMGQFGQSVIQDTAKRISSEFLACVKGQIETPEGQKPPPPLSEAKAARVGMRAFAGASWFTARGWFRRLLRRKRTSEQP